MKSKSKRSLRKKRVEIRDYDGAETTGMINPANPLALADLGLALPATPPTQVVSIRLPSSMLNELRAIGSQKDVPYQALVKLFLAQAIADFKKKDAA